MAVADNLDHVRAKIVAACDRSRRDPTSVVLVAVSKTFGLRALEEAYAAGQRHFGESRLQEAIPKIEAMPVDVAWHFVGPLQSNKAKRIASLFQTVHSFENERQIREADKAASQVSGLIEVNIAIEPQKSGVAPDPETIIELRDQMRDFRGLMTIGPDVGPQAIRPYFARLRELNEEVGGTWLSMGMSQDYEVAIEEGATHIRIGSAIFGSR